jgi:hypothetical protein
MIGETTTRAGQDAGGKEIQLVSHNNSIGRCRIERCGQSDFGAVGLWIGIASHTQAINNDISQLPYTGISVGWKWDTSPTGCSHNEIANNHIHHVMQTLSDGGGIYTLGRQPETKLLGNHIHDIPTNAGRAESNGMFLDEGTSLIVVEKNLIYGVERSPIRFHQAEKVRLLSNRLVHKPDIPTFRYNSASPESMTMEGNEEIEAKQWQPMAGDPAAKVGVGNWVVGSTN